MILLFLFVCLFNIQKPNHNKQFNQKMLTQITFQWGTTVLIVFPLVVFAFILFRKLMSMGKKLQIQSDQLEQNVVQLPFDAEQIKTQEKIHQATALEQQNTDYVDEQASIAEREEQIKSQIENFYEVQLSENLIEQEIKMVLKKKLEALSQKYLKKGLMIQDKSQPSYQKQIKEAKKQLEQNNIYVNRYKEQSVWTETVRFELTRQTKKFNNSLNGKILGQKQKQIQKRGFIKYYKKRINQNLIFQTPKLSLCSLRELFQQFMKDDYLYRVSIDEMKQMESDCFQISFKIKIENLKNRAQELINRIRLETNQDTNENIHLISTEVCQEQLQRIRRLAKQFQKNNVELEDIKSGKVKSSVMSSKIDIAIVMDTTSSMGTYIEKAKKDSIQIIKSFKQNYQNSSIKYSFISYKDHDCQRVCQYADFDDAHSTQKKIQKIQVQGGSDQAQAMHDGLFAVSKLSWRSQSTKFVFVIYDAPPHGRQYAKYQNASDSYPDGCPCGIKLQSIVNFFRQKNIYINLKECGSRTGRTQAVFKKAFPNKLFGVENMDSQQFASQITKNLNQRIKELQQSNRLFALQLSSINDNLLHVIRSMAKKIIQQKIQFTILKQLTSQVLRPKLL